MDGVTAIRTVLVGNAALIAVVPASRIAAGPMPQGSALPFICLQSISSTDRNIPSPGTTRHVRERVQVTVLASNYAEQKAVLRAVRHAAADALNPSVSGITGVTIHTDGTGPDGMAENASIWIGTQDFIVRYQETR